MKKHLAIMYRPAIEAILSGRKTIETRFSKNKISPFGQISRGDLIFMKPPGEDIIGQFRVKKVFSYEGLVKEDIEKIFQEYEPKISWPDEGFNQFKEDKKNCSFGTLIFISDSERFITSPVKIKKKDLRGWVVLN